MFILFLGGIAVLFYVMTKSSVATAKSCEKLHKWTVTGQTETEHGRLRCSECGQLPGEET